MGDCHASTVFADAKVPDNDNDETQIRWVIGVTMPELRPIELYLDRVVSLMAWVHYSSAFRE